MSKDSAQTKESSASLKIALFATGSVGIKIASFLQQVNNPPVCLILDSKSTEEDRQNLIAALPGVLVIESSSLTDEKILDVLKTLQLDLSILAWWPYILKQPIISIPSIGTLNFHPSLLPYNRGKHYNFWTIVEESPFGVTLHWVNAGIDTGDIAFQREIVKTWEDTGQTLYDKAQKEIVSLFKDNWQSILNKDIPRKPQLPDTGTYHQSKDLHLASEIKLAKNYTGKELLNILRARTFPPHPGAWFLGEDGKQYQARIHIEAIENPKGENDKEEGIISSVARKG
jgi:methionyl-tRNA formyltransferase